MSKDEDDDQRAPYEKDPQGHVWETYEDGSINIFAYSEGYCNGPVCVNCKASFCHHCSVRKIPSYIGSCKKSNQ